MNEINITSSPIEELYRTLGTGPNGLSVKLAQERVAAQHRSEQKETRFQRELKLLIRQFTNPLILLLIVAVILSAILKESSDALIILFILCSTGLTSFFQERKAGRAVEELQKMIRLTCDVIRDGKDLVVEAQDVVPGDLIKFRAGDIIPADCRIINCNELHVNESALTGESYPVAKSTGIINDKSALSQKYNCLWKGTNVVSGTATALVVQTGSGTVFGKLQKGLSQPVDTAFEKGMRGFGYFLLKITIVLSIVILAVNIYFEKPLFDAILFSLAISVGMAPELLPAIMAFAMSAGARRMMQKKVIVKKLSSIFNFGEVEILCTDKTGTITEGKIKVDSMIDPFGEPNSGLGKWAWLNARFQNGFSNPIDEAILALGVNVTGYEKADEIPYDFIRKRLSILLRNNGQYIIVTKGAVPEVLEVCTQIEMNGEVKPMNPDDRKKIDATFQNFGKRGFRLLGLCRKDHADASITKTDEQNMIFMGFILLVDPLKESAIESIEKLRKLNVNVKIITGDNRYTAFYVAEQLQINNPKIICGPELNDISPEALAYQALETDVFAEIEPHQKERIIRALQKTGKAVAYMGDGINDVAAIHAADTGISVNDAVDVAKEVADFVLIEKDLSVLADGIIEGRKSFANSMKYILINTGATFGNMFSVAGASLLLPFLPMLPKQILLTNFLTDFPYLSVASDNVDEELLTRPRKWRMKSIKNFMILFGIHSSLFDFLTFYVLLFHFHLSSAAFQTGWFLESVFTELLILFVIRTYKPFFSSRPGKALVLTSLLAFLITLLLPISPFAGMLGLSIAHVKQILAIGLILILYVITADILKIIYFRRLSREV